MYIKKDGVNTVKETVKRNISNYTEEVFFSEDLPHLDQLKEAVEFTKDYLDLNSNTTVTIIGDYDTDGICATSILYWAFKAYGVTANTRLPRRFSEGYGLSEKIIDEIENGLIVTVDNGIAARKAIDKAKNKGMSVIVIDHHLPPRDSSGNLIIPNADVILDPHLNPEKSDFEDYCGAGLAYRFAKELLPDMKLTELMMLASLATVADIMPLYGANRKLVIDGLNAFNHRKVLPGIKELIRMCQLSNNEAEDCFGFKIGPIFNASGRLFDNGAERVLRLLKMGNDDPKLPFKAKNLIDTNEKRKEIAREDIARTISNLDSSRPIVVYDDKIGEGIIGLVSGKLAEDYHCPVITFTKTECEGVIKGSARSIPEIHLKNVLDKIQDKILGYGGHAGAAGLSIELSRLDEFKEAFKEACGEIPELSEDYYYDLELEADEIPSVVEQLKFFAPYGEGNPKILFHFVYNVNPSDFKRIGDGTHFMIKDDLITIMGFGKADEYEAKGKPERLDMVGYLSESWYGDNCSYKFEILSFND